MNDLPRQKLIEIVTHRQAVTARTGRDVLSDAKLCGALLRDLCGEHKREISVLVAAVEERVPNDLQSSQANTPIDVLLARLTKRLVDDRALAEDPAKWAVESWALALGLALPQPVALASTIVQFMVFVAATKYSWPTKLDVKARANHPVTDVNWADAVAFCAWATKQTGLKVRLPTEAEWEKAARGIDGRMYPWGEAEPTYHLCNFNMTVKGTTPVGQYSPQGDSPYGCADMAGNVWEWCADGYDENYYIKARPRNPLSPTSGQYCVLRGGSWKHEALNVHVSYRGRFTSVYRDGYDGFRCVLS